MKKSSQEGAEAAEESQISTAILCSPCDLLFNPEIRVSVARLARVILLPYHSPSSMVSKSH